MRESGFDKHKLRSELVARRWKNLKKHQVIWRWKVSKGFVLYRSYQLSCKETLQRKYKVKSKVPKNEDLLWLEQNKYNKNNKLNETFTIALPFFGL